MTMQPDIRQDVHRLPDMHVRQWRLLEIGDDADLVRNRRKNGFCQGWTKSPAWTVLSATVPADGLECLCFIIRRFDGLIYCGGSDLR
jgi:hypothetical protein